MQRIKFLLLLAVLLPTAPRAFCDAAVNNHDPGRVMQIKRGLDSAIADFTNSTGLERNSAKSYGLRAIARLGKGDLDGAIADYTKALKFKPDFAYAYGNRGTAKQAKEDLDGAISDYTKAIELKPDAAEIFCNRGLAKKAKGDFDGAIRDYTKALELKPDYANACHNRGEAKQAKGDWDGASADYTKALELKPGDAAAYRNRSAVRRAKGDLEGASADDSKTIKLNPTYARGYYHRGFDRYGLRDFKNASVDFRKAVELDSSQKYARFGVWLVRARQGETEAATIDLKTFMARHLNGKPNDWPSKIGLFLTGQLAEPEFLAAAKNGEPKKEAGRFCEAYFYAGSKHLFAGDKSTALDYFQKSIATDQKSYTEYIIAVAELKFLSAQKN